VFHSDLLNYYLKNWDGFVDGKREDYENFKIATVNWHAKRKYSNYEERRHVAMQLNKRKENLQPYYKN
jgi:hypothetical protein